MRRHELKVRCGPLDWPVLETKIHKNYEASQVFPPRVVNSIYFDTLDYRFFHLSEEGLTPRKKYRVRWYGDADLIDSTYVQAEIKSTLPYAREKICIYEGPFHEFEGFQVRNPEPLFECLKTSYRRRYLQAGDVRFTIDTDIVAFGRGLLPNKRVEFSYAVLEIKCPLEFSTEHFQDALGRQIVRSSKYCDGVNMVLADSTAL